MIIGRKLEDLTPEIILETLRHQAKQGVIILRFTRVF